MPSDVEQLKKLIQKCIEGDIDESGSFVPSDRNVLTRTEMMQIIDQAYQDGHLSQDEMGVIDNLIMNSESDEDGNLILNDVFFANFQLES